MPGSFPKNVQIAMSLRDTTTDEMANFRESRAQSLFEKVRQQPVGGPSTGSLAR
jgi:hypothetical protein